jgi:hypothetical protein
VSIEKVFKEFNDWALWEYGGAALIAVGRSLFARSSSQPPPSAASDPGMTLTPKGWELDNSRLKGASEAGSSRSFKGRRGSAERF